MIAIFWLHAPKFGYFISRQPLKSFLLDLVYQYWLIYYYFAENMDFQICSLNQLAFIRRHVSSVKSRIAFWVPKL